MSALTIFAIIFGFILIVGGWITSEYISNKNAKLVKQFRLYSAKLERENNALQHQINQEQDKYHKLHEEHEKIKDAKLQIRDLQTEFKNLMNRYSNNLRGIEIIRKTVTSKKYINNSLAKEITNLLSEHLPDEKQMEMNKNEESRQAFKRIKEGMPGR